MSSTKVDKIPLGKMSLAYCPQRVELMRKLLGVLCGGALSGAVVHGAGG
jgi:hypothetical protein